MTFEVKGNREFARWLREWSARNLVVQLPPFEATSVEKWRSDSRLGTEAAATNCELGSKDKS